MALSEHEERILAEIERSLVADDPEFVERARKTTSRDAQLRNLRWSIVAFVLGLASLFGLVFNFAFGVAGFALMFGAAVVGGRAVSALGAPTAEDLVNRLRRSDRSGDTPGE